MWQRQLWLSQGLSCLDVEKSLLVWPHGLLYPLPERNSTNSVYTTRKKIKTVCNCICFLYEI